MTAQPTAPVQPRRYIDAPTAWKTVPGFLRFMLWLWAVSIICGAVGGLIFLIAVGSAFS